jgi:hypothetical protein
MRRCHLVGSRVVLITDERFRTFERLLPLGSRLLRYRQDLQNGPWTIVIRCSYLAATLRKGFQFQDHH